MSNACLRNFKKGQIIYLVDCWGTSNGIKAIGTQAEILQVDEKKQIFCAVLYGYIYQTYSFKDYGRLIFDTEKEAIEAADKLPNPQSIVYQIKGKRVYKKRVFGINGIYIDGVYDLEVWLYRGKNISTKEIGQSLFLNESDARENKK